MVNRVHRRIQFARESGAVLPLYVESIGYNPDQEDIVRLDGYPAYHWLQTSEGEGRITFEDSSFSLPPNSGVLLLPNIPHRYEATSKQWRTYYLTFAGPAVRSMLESINLHICAFFHWEQQSPLNGFLEDMLARQESSQDQFGLYSSSDAYHLLLMLTKYGQLQNNTAISSNLDKLRPLLDWMETNYGDPSIGLQELAAQLQVSGRHMNTLFMQTFGLSPYAYLVRLRIRKAKELLIHHPEATVKDIAAWVGYREDSHFVATFRKQTGVTPQQFRRLY